MNYRTLLAAALTAALLCGCSEKSSAPVSEPEQTHTSAVTETTAVHTTEAPSSPDTQTTEQTTVSDVQTSEVQQTTVTAESTVTLPTTEPTQLSPVLVTTAIRIINGGEGGEEHAQEPLPLYFDYRFYDDSVAVRLAGGTYQSLQYDFSETLRHGAAEQYTLLDFNFDGSDDLAVPVKWDGANTTWAVFFWEPDSLHFRSEPDLCCNPIPVSEDKSLYEITYITDESGPVRTEIRIRFFNDPALSYSFVGDYTGLMLKCYAVQGDSKKNYMTHYKSRDALTEALQDLLP